MCHSRESSFLATFEQARRPSWAAAPALDVGLTARRMGWIGSWVGCSIEIPTKYTAYKRRTKFPSNASQPPYRISVVRCAILENHRFPQPIHLAVARGAAHQHLATPVQTRFFRDGVTGLESPIEITTQINQKDTKTNSGNDTSRFKSRKNGFGPTEAVTSLLLRDSLRCKEDSG